MPPCRHGSASPRAFAPSTSAADLLINKPRLAIVRINNVIILVAVCSPG